jgi:hydroxyethylthiazole kinase-like uncharacterized protein yjeF
MRKVTPDRPWPLHGAASTRRLEHAAAVLPPHALMERAGRAVARLAMAVAPHAQTVWIACGPGNNGGDGFEAALHLQQAGRTVHLTLDGIGSQLPPDAGRALQKAEQAGLRIGAAPPGAWDLCIDALLGLGGRRPLDGALAQTAARIADGPGRVLAVDVPSGLDADTGAGRAVRAHHTLALLTLKPGLFTAGGRDVAGEVWLDTLGVEADGPDAWLAGPPPARARAHASHKGHWGDVAVVGGAPGMLGAAVLAAQAALHAGAGRVLLAPLQPLHTGLVPGWPELMVRPPQALEAERMAVACGCGGGDAVAAVLPGLLARAAALVLDADALNAVAADAALAALLRDRAAAGRPTVLTPHPLEAARLLGTGTDTVQSDRLTAARGLVDRFGCTVLLKGSGSVVAAPGRLPHVNPTGNARLATAGTGDVLAGLVAARLAAGEEGFTAACAAAWLHGSVADGWPPERALTAGALAQALRP